MISVMDERWEDSGTSAGMDLADRLREAVARPFDAWRDVYESFSPVDLKTGERRPRVPPPGANSRRAAVLVPILIDNGEARVVYTVRKEDLADHAGQISFPGGSAESADGSLMETALREAEEEIDLSPGLVEVIGELEEMYIPPSNFRVSPFVGLLPPEAELVLAPDEVEEIFTVSLEDAYRPRDAAQGALALRRPRLRGARFRRRWPVPAQHLGRDGGDDRSPSRAPGLAGLQALGTVCCGSSP